MTSTIVDRRAAAAGTPVRKSGVKPPNTHRELELGAIIDSYNQVTEKLKQSHEQLTCEVRRLRERLAEQDRELQRRRQLAALGEMAAGVAHEVRNPLGGILLYATMLEQDLQSQPSACRIASRIAAAARTLDAVVGDILAFANPQPPNRKQVVLDDVAAEVVELLRPRWADVGCEVRLQRADPPVVVPAEADQIQRALLNVASNAIDAAGQCGHVWITIRPAKPGERWAAVSVADDGPGVPEELTEKIFLPFFTTKDSGTGLGLAIVHRILEAHGGRVTIATPKEGGAVFTLWLTDHPDRSDETQEQN